LKVSCLKLSGKKAVLEIYKELEREKKLEVAGRPKDISKVHD